MGEHGTKEEGGPVITEHYLVEKSPKKKHGALTGLFPPPEAISLPVGVPLPPFLGGGDEYHPSLVLLRPPPVDGQVR